VSQTVLIESARLVVREFTADHVSALYAVVSDPDVVRYLAFGPPSETETRGMVDWAIASQSAEPRTSYALAVIERSSGDLIGSCGLELAGDSQVTAETYFALRKQSWGVGYGTEVVAAVVDHALRSLGLHRIWAHVVPGNDASRRVVEKIGMTYEGLVRGVILKDGQWHDAHQYAILEDDPRS
jgi:ribosomal-protein-alanine N-acetyltransferase